MSLEERELRRLRAKEWRENNKERLSEYNKKYAKANSERLSEKARLNRLKNKERQDAKHKEWLAKNPDNKRNGDLLRQYGINLNDYHKMLEEQKHLCKICKGPPTGKGVLHVDHCHETGSVRGLLCNKCNIGLGHFNDSKELLQKALDYLTVNR